MKKSGLKHEQPDSRIVNEKGVKRTVGWVDRKRENENSAEAVRDRWKGNRK